MRALVIGDLMIDEYLWGRAERISPEAPVPVVDVQRQDLRLGGAGNVLHNLHALGVQTGILGLVGDDDRAAQMHSLLEQTGTDASGLIMDAGRRTAVKTRLMADNQQMVRIDRETRQPIGQQMQRQALEFIDGRLDEYDVLILSDYGKGLLVPELCHALIERAAERGIPLFVDPKGTDYRKYRGATSITPNRRETAEATGIDPGTAQGLARAGRALLEDYTLAFGCITRSEEGISLFFRDGRMETVPTIGRDVFDVTGAGDTVISVLATAYACGLDPVDCARLANAAAGVVVAKVGTSIATPEEIMQNLNWERRAATRKIREPQALAQVLEARRAAGERIAFTNGCFDLLHVGHISYLQQARQQGDTLVLGLNSDDSIRRLKGPNRPIIGQEERAHVLAALECIDYVVIFDEDTPEQLIGQLRPDLLIKGGDYRPEQVVGRELVESWNGSVVILPFLEGNSTSGIIERVLQRHGLEAPHAD